MICVYDIEWKSFILKSLTPLPIWKNNCCLSIISTGTHNCQFEFEGIFKKNNTRM